MCESHSHEICQHLDIIMVIQAVLHMAQELKDINTIQARVQQCVHALKCCLTNIQAIINGVLEWSHLHFPDEFFLQKYISTNRSV